MNKMHPIPERIYYLDNLIAPLTFSNLARHLNTVSSPFRNSIRPASSFIMLGI